jgi:hypothetical protein
MRRDFIGWICVWADGREPLSRSEKAVVVYAPESERPIRAVCKLYISYEPLRDCLSSGYEVEPV